MGVFFRGGEVADQLAAQVLDEELIILEGLIDLRGHRLGAVAIGDALGWGQTFGERVRGFIEGAKIEGGPLKEGGAESQGFFKAVGIDELARDPVREGVEDAEVDDLGVFGREILPDGPPIFFAEHGSQDAVDKACGTAAAAGFDIFHGLVDGGVGGNSIEEEELIGRQPEADEYGQVEFVQAAVDEALKQGVYGSLSGQGAVDELSGEGAVALIEG